MATPEKAIYKLSVSFSSFGAYVKIQNIDTRRCRRNISISKFFVFKSDLQNNSEKNNKFNGTVHNKIFRQIQPQNKE